MALPPFDPLWNFGDPPGTETSFRELLHASQDCGDNAYLSELLTQIARAQGLQQKYDDAFATLDQAGTLITPGMSRSRVRSLLERGRVLNSSGKSQEAIPFFEQALEVARSSGLDFYAVDAAHMLGIACKGDASLRWNEEAVAIAESSSEARARNWLGALYNNTGWTYHDMGRHDDALRMFEKHLAYRTAQNNTEQMNIARWSIGKTLRFIGRVDEALQMQTALLADAGRQGNDSEGYTQEEIGECLLALKRPQEAAPFFARAWELLHDDPWLKQDDSARLERLRQHSIANRASGIQ